MQINPALRQPGTLQSFLKRLQVTAQPWPWLFPAQGIIAVQPRCTLSLTPPRAQPPSRSGKDRYMAGAPGAPKSRSYRNNKALSEAKRERSRGQPQMLSQDLLPADGPAVMDDALSIAPEQPGEWGAKRVSLQPGPWIGCAATSLAAAEAPLQRPGLGRSQVGKEQVQHLAEVPCPDSFPACCDAPIWSCQRRAEPQSKV